MPLSSACPPLTQRMRWGCSPRRWVVWTGAGMCALLVLSLSSFASQLAAAVMSE